MGIFINLFEGGPAGGGLQHVSSSPGQQGTALSMEPMARLMAVKNGTVGKQQICDLKTARYYYHH